MNPVVFAIFLVLTLLDLEAIDFKKRNVLPLIYHKLLIIRVTSSQITVHVLICIKKLYAHLKEIEIISNIINIGN